MANNDIEQLEEALNKMASAFQLRLREAIIKQQRNANPGTDLSANSITLQGTVKEPIKLGGSQAKASMKDRVYSFIREKLWWR